MPNIIQDRVEEMLKRLPRRWLPTFFLSSIAREQRLAFLEAVKREFNGKVNLKESLSLKEVQKQIEGNMRMARAEREINKQIDFSEGFYKLIPFKFSKDSSPGQRSIADDPGIMRLLDKHGYAIDGVKRDLTARGFNPALGPAILGDIFSKQQSFQAAGRIAFGTDNLHYNVHYERSSETGRYHATRVEAKLKKEVKLERDNINDVDLIALQKRMSEIDWRLNFINGMAVASSDPEENRRIIGKVGEIFNDLLKVMTGKDPEGRKTHDQLTYKYLSDTPNYLRADSWKSLKDKYEINLQLDIGNASSQVFSPREMYNLMNFRAVKGNKVDSSSPPWYQMHSNNENALGLYKVAAIPESDKIVLEAALIKAGVQEIRDPDGNRNPEKLLRQGESVEASLLQHGILVNRMVSMDPVNNSIQVDYNESVNRGLVPQVTEGQDKVREYVLGYFKPTEKPALEFKPGMSGGLSDISPTGQPILHEIDHKLAKTGENLISPAKGQDDKFDIDEALWRLGMKSNYEGKEQGKGASR